MDRNYTTYKLMESQIELAVKRGTLSREEAFKTLKGAKASYSAKSLDKIDELQKRKK